MRKGSWRQTSASGQRQRAPEGGGSGGKVGPCEEKSGPGEKVKRGTRKWETFLERQTQTQGASFWILPPSPGSWGFPASPHRGSLEGPAFGVPR